MDNTGEQRYLQLLGGFTAEERERLPLEYSIYGSDFSGIVGAFVESGIRLDIPELTTMDRLSRKLAQSIDRQLDLAGPWKPPLILLPRDRRKIRAQRQIVRQVIARRSASLHRQILQEYFFLTNFVELMVLVQKAAARALGGEISEPNLSLYEGASAQLVKIFQDTDKSYESIQSFLAEHGQVEQSQG